VFKKEGRSDKKAFKKRVGKGQPLETPNFDQTVLKSSLKNEKQINSQISEQASANFSNTNSVQENTQQKDSLIELKERLLESRLGKRPNPFSDINSQTSNQTEKSKQGDTNQSNKPETNTKASQTTNEGPNQPTYLYMNQYGQLFTTSQCFNSQENPSLLQHNQQFQPFLQQRNILNCKQISPQEMDSNSQKGISQTHIQIQQYPNQLPFHQNNSNQNTYINQQQAKLTNVQSGINSNENPAFTSENQSSQGSMAYFCIPAPNQIQYYSVPMQNVAIGQYNHQQASQYPYTQQPMFLTNQNNNSQNYSLHTYQIGGNYIPQQNSYIFVGQNQNPSSQLNTEFNKGQINQIQTQNENKEAKNNVKKD